MQVMESSLSSSNLSIIGDIPTFTNEQERADFNEALFAFNALEREHQSGMAANQQRIRLDIDDARRGGFGNRFELAYALRRDGYRFQPINNYEFYRIQFTWLEEVYGT